MKQLFFLSIVLLTTTALAKPAKNSPRNVDLKSADATILKATYFATTKSGPVALLFHQSNRMNKTAVALLAPLAFCLAGFCAKPNARLTP